MGDDGQHRRAATLLGAADAFWTDIGTTITSYRHLIAFHDRCERHTRDALGDATFAEAYHSAQVLSYEDAIAYALDVRRKPTPPSPDDAVRLTRREREVADLVANGLSNKEIAARLVISHRTAESHVEHILTKLGVTSRAQVAAWVGARSGELSP